MAGLSLMETSGNVQRPHIDKGKQPLAQRYSMQAATPRTSSKQEMHRQIQMQHAQPQAEDRLSKQSEAFQFDLDRHLSVNAYDLLSTVSSEDEREPEYTWEPPRQPPSTLPPIPVLPDTFPLPIHAYHMQHSPILGHSSERKVSPIAIGNPAQHFGPSAHQKTASQKYLLPSMPAQRPMPQLTLDKPAAKKDRVVQVHRLLFACGLLFPPLLLCLAFGVFDEICYLGEQASLRGNATGMDGQVRRIKQAAAIVGGVVMMGTVAGFVVGLVLA